MTDIPRKYPYLPEDREILYVPADNEFMSMAKEQAQKYSTDLYVSTGSVVVKNENIIGQGANQSAFHKDTPFHKKMAALHQKVCLRDLFGIPTGEKYWACPACVGHEGHSEHRAVADARARKNDTKGADLYMYGHWWCCKPCWDAMIEAGIRNVYLLDKSWEIFDI